jgi:hypothetical protein
MILVLVERLAGSYFVNRGGFAMCLVEETETHVLIGLFLLLLLGGLGCGLSLSGATSGSSTTGSGSATGTTRWNGSKLLGTRLDELVDVLALELGNQLVKAVGVSLDTDRLKDGLLCIRQRQTYASSSLSHLDVGSGRRGVATKAEEEVCREMLHCDCGLVICVGTGVQSI